MLSIFRKPSSIESFVDVPTAADSTGEDASQSGEDVVQKNSTGGISEIRTLYEGPHDEDGNWEWQTEYPKDLIRKGPAPENIPPNKLYSLVVQEERTGLKSKPLQLKSITVQSPHVKRVLSELLSDCYNIGDMRLKNPIFDPPYRELYYVWPAFEAAVENQTDPVATEHLRLFHNLVSKDVRKMRNKQLPLDKHNKANFDTLFTHFKPGQVVYHKSKDTGYERFLKVTTTEYSGNYRPSQLTITCAFLEWDGVRLGWSEEWFKIYRFAGPKKVAELEIFPAELHPEYEELKERILQRGKRWSAMRKPTVVEYSGPTPEQVEADRWGRGGGTRKVHGRVMIDPAAYEAYGSKSISLSNGTDFNHYFKPALTFDESADADDDDDDDETVVEPTIDNQSDSDYEEYGEQHEESNEEEVKPEDRELSDDMLVLASHIVYGCSLKTKDWVQLYIELANEVPWNYEAFDRLVLPGNFKQMILAFVESQAANRDVFDDIIEGKGQGIIMLLHGSPGLGKTLTAEAVADRLQKPLYSVQAGELGSKAKHVETKLEQILEIAAKWDAVLLLDEADVFLEQRHHSDLERNKIVSVFLRLLEYYRGILFLTSNRVETFDEAFRSRIHLKINYPDLDAQAKFGIWKNFIDASKKKNGSDVTEANIQDLAQEPFNGREIKNVVKTAQLLAARDSEPLQMKHFKICLDVLEQGKGQQEKTLMI